MIIVVACPHPLRASRLVFEAAGRPTVEDLVVEAAARGKVPLAALGNAVVVIGDRLVPKDRWLHTRPKSGTVVIKALPGDPVSLTVAVLGSAASWGVGALVPTAFALAHPLATAAIIGIAQAGIGIVTSLAVGALAQAPKQRRAASDGPTDPTFSIQGVRNEARPYQPIPKIYGRRVRYYPVQAALPYTEVFYDNNQFVRAIFDVGYGPLAISDIRIGDTPIAQYRGISYEVRQGYPGDAPLTLFPSQVREESLSIQLKYTSGFSIRTTQPDTDECSLDVTFPSGLIRISADNKFGLEVQFEVQYRPAGTSTWLAAPLTSNHFGVYFLGGGKFKVAAKEKAAVRRSVWFRFPTRGQYDVQVRRLTIDDQADNVGKHQSYTQEDSFWSAVRSFRNDAPVRKSGIARIAIRAQATDQLNGVIDQLNCTVQAILPVWNGSAWVEQQTRSPAWAFCDVLRGAANARSVAASRIDLARMLEWDAQATADGATFDAEIAQQRSVIEWLDDIAATANATRIMRDGLYSVALDNAKSVVVQHFTPRNSRAFQSSKIFAKRPHGIKVRFPSEAAYHQIDEIPVYDDGYSASNATLFETLELPYTTSAAQAWKRGRRALFTSRLRPEVYSLETDIEHIVCEENDLVRVTHDVPMWGVSFARVAALATSGGDTIGVTLDAPVPMAGGSFYACRFRLATGATLLVPVDTAPGEQPSLTFTTPVATASGPAIGDLVLFGASGTDSVELVVRTIEPLPDHGARITFVDYAPAIQTAATGEVPEFDPQITLPPAVNRPLPPKPVITSIDSDEDVLIRASNGTLTSRILVAVQVDQLATTTPAELLQARYRPADTSQDWQFVGSVPAPAGTISVMPVDDGDTYEIELRSVSQVGGTSEWIRTTHTVEGKTAPPPDVERFYRQGNALTWPYPSPPIDLAGFLLRANYDTSTDWGTARALHPGVVTAPPFDISALSGTQTILIKAVDTSGIESTNAASVTLDLGDLPVSNVVETQSEAPDWTGTLTGGTDTGTDIEADLESAAPMYGPAAAQLYGAAGDPFFEGNYYAAMSYVASYTPDALYLGDGLLKLEITVTGDYALDYRICTSPALYGASGDPFYGTGSDDFYAASEVGEWTPWPGVLGPFESSADTYEVRLTTAAGATQGVCSQFDLITDLPDVVEQLEDVVIAAASTRLPITKTFRVIKGVSLTVQTDGNGGVTARTIDKDATLGPDTEVLNSSGTAVQGLVDARIWGY